MAPCRPNPKGTRGLRHHTASELLPDAYSIASSLFLVWHSQAPGTRPHPTSSTDLVTRASMARGELSFSKVRALTRVATPSNEADLLELARGCTTARTEKIVRAGKKHSRASEADLERELHESRSLSVFPDDEGMYVVRGKLPAEVGALLMRAIEAASDAIWRNERAKLPAEVREALRSHGERRGCSGTAEARPHESESRRAAARRRADALALIAERAMGAGFGGCDDPISGTRAERYQVMLHVSAETLREDAEPDRSHLEDGTRVSAETSRRLSCDTAVVRVAHGESQLLDVGRRTRTIPPALRRALDVRDGGCRFPGCGLRFTDAHHVKHWADGGETSLGNCLLLCRHHHRLVHEEGWRVRWAGAPRVHRPARRHPLPAGRLRSFPRRSRPGWPRGLPRPPGRSSRATASAVSSRTRTPPRLAGSASRTSRTRCTSGRSRRLHRRPGRAIEVTA